MAGHGAILDLGRPFADGHRIDDLSQSVLGRAALGLAHLPRGVVLLLQGDRLIGHVTIKNAGNLPAQNLGWFINIKQSHHGKETDFPLEHVKGNIVVL